MERWYNDLHQKLAVYEKKMMQYKEKVDELNIRNKIWKKEQKEQKVNFRKTVEAQTKINDSMSTNKVVQMIKQKENLVRDVVDRKKTNGIWFDPQNASNNFVT